MPQQPKFASHGGLVNRYPDEPARKQDHLLLKSGVTECDFCKQNYLDQITYYDMFSGWTANDDNPGEAFAECYRAYKADEPRYRVLCYSCVYDQVEKIEKSPNRRAAAKVARKTAGKSGMASLWYDPMYTGEYPKPKAGKKRK